MYKKRIYLISLSIVVLTIAVLSGCDVFLDLIKDSIGFDKDKMPVKMQEGTNWTAPVLLKTKPANEDTTISFKVTPSNFSHRLSANSVVIPVGKTSVNFTMAAKTTDVIDGDVELTFTASAPGFHSDSWTLKILDRTPTPIPTSTPTPSPTPTPMITVSSILSVYPPPNASNVSTQLGTRHSILITFDIPVKASCFELTDQHENPGFIRLYKIQSTEDGDAIEQVAGIPRYLAESYTVVFTPVLSLKPNTFYKVAISAETRSAENKEFFTNDYVWSFSTGSK